MGRIELCDNMHFHEESAKLVAEMFFGMIYSKMTRDLGTPHTPVEVRQKRSAQRCSSVEEKQEQSSQPSSSKSGGNPRPSAMQQKQQKTKQEASVRSRGKRPFSSSPPKDEYVCGCACRSAAETREMAVAIGLPSLPSDFVEIEKGSSWYLCKCTECALSLIHI